MAVNRKVPLRMNEENSMETNSPEGNRLTHSIWSEWSFPGDRPGSKESEIGKFKFLCLKPEKASINVLSYFEIWVTWKMNRTLNTLCSHYKFNKKSLQALRDTVFSPSFKMKYSHLFFGTLEHECRRNSVTPLTGLSQGLFQWPIFVKELTNETEMLLLRILFWMQHALGVKNEKLACEFHWECTYCFKKTVKVLQLKDLNSLFIVRKYFFDSRYILIAN